MNPTTNPTRNELPDSLFPVKTAPIGELNAQELEHLARKPQKKAELPSRPMGEMERRRIQHLAQYQGRSLQGNKKALANLRRRMEDPIVPIPVPMPESVVPPTIPTAPPPPKGIDPLRAKYLHTCLSKEEYDLYEATWKDWISNHPDYNQVEDKSDVETICMETVLQYRINLIRMQRPNRDYDKQYHNSYNRMQKARENLAARRIDRVGTADGKGNGRSTTNIFANKTFNVAVMAGKVNDKKMIELERKAKLNVLSDVDALEKSTVKSSDLATLDAEISRDTTSERGLAAQDLTSPAEASPDAAGEEPDGPEQEPQP